MAGRDTAGTRGRRKFGTKRWREDCHAWYVSWTQEGQRPQRRVGPDESKADQVLARVQHLVEEGRSLAYVLKEVFRETTGHKLTFLEAIPHYLAYAEPRKKASTFQGDVSRFRVLARARWAKKNLGQISPLDLTHWANRRTSGPKAVAGATVNRGLHLISALFTWALRMGYVETHPVRAVAKFSEKGRARTLWLTVEEGDALLDAAQEDLRRIMLCLLHAGLRSGEARELQWRSVDLERHEIVIEPETTKGGEARYIPMTEKLGDMLVDLHTRASPAPHSPVFLRRNGAPWTKFTLPYHVTKAARKATAITTYRRTGITPHILRHTFASHLAQAGVPFQDIAYVLGHTTTYITQRYAHLAPEMGRRAIAALEQRLGEGAAQVSDAVVPYTVIQGHALVPLKCLGIAVRNAS